MNFRFLLLAIPLLIFGGGAWLLIRMGVFKPVQIREETVGPFFLVGQEHVGPYYEISKAIQEVEKWAQARNIDCRRSFGHFLDDPEIVEHERLRSVGGCVVDQVPESLPSDFKTIILPSEKYIVAYYAGASALGPWKVYAPVYSELRQRQISRPSVVTEFYYFDSNHEFLTQYLFKLTP